MAIIKNTLTLNDLPPPPPGKSGWPWTKQSQLLPEQRPDGSKWPRISIVTPSYNQGQFLEETIRSVLLQGYPNLEYIIIDGGSTDNSVEIVKKYEQYLAYWVSERDRGQSDALNKGFNHCSGDIYAYINSDDLFLANAFHKVSNAFVIHKTIKWLASSVLVGESIEESYIWRPHTGTLPLFVVNQLVAQQGIFWVPDVHPQPYFDLKCYYGMDHKFFSKIYFKLGSPFQLDEKIAFFRSHPNSKTYSPDLKVTEFEWQSLSEEIALKSDFKTAIQIRKEQRRKLAYYEITKLLNAEDSTIKSSLQSFLKSVSILLRVPFPLRDRIFISAVIRLGSRLIVNAIRIRDRFESTNE